MHQVKNLEAKEINDSYELSLDTAILNRKHPEEAKSAPFRASVTAGSEAPENTERNLNQLTRKYHYLPRTRS